MSIPCETPLHRHNRLQIEACSAVKNVKYLACTMVAPVVDAVEIHLPMMETSILL